MRNSTTNFFEVWNNYFVLTSYVCLGIAVFIILLHEIRIVFTANEKDRYDYVNKHEIRFFWYAIIAFIAGISLYLSAVITPYVVVDSSVKVYVSLFFLAAFVVVAYMVLSSLVRILYPRFLESRLSRIRNKPRVSGMGNTMRKLSLKEGAVHLEEIQMNENSKEMHSVEYDVWIDDKTGEKRIEKYVMLQHADKCTECGFYTMKIDSEEIVKKPDFQQPGLLVEHYRCSYCNHREAKEVTVASLSTNVMGAV
jgi:hypothetical protein